MPNIQHGIISLINFDFANSITEVNLFFWIICIAKTYPDTNTKASSLKALENRAIHLYPHKIHDKYQSEFPKLHKRVQKHGIRLIRPITRGA